MDLDSLPTPSLVVDRRRLEANLRAMADRCRRLGVSLRPHVKTHKCVEIARRQIDLGAVGLTVATLAEAAAFAAAGFDDLTLAIPLQPGRSSELAALAERVRLGVLVDSFEAADELEVLDLPLRVWIKVDCGYHRAGVDPRGAVVLPLASRLAASRTLDFAGLLTHSGHAYHAVGDEAALRVAEQERSVMADLAETLRSQGLAVPEVSVGSTPALTRARSLAGCTEARPGNYVYFDLMQVALGSCGLAECALSVVASVVSSAEGADRCVIDAGALALSKEIVDAPEASYGEIWSDHEAALLDRQSRVVGLSQEHGILSQRRPRGNRVRVLPVHACLAAACFDEVVVVEEETVVDRWPIQRRR